MFGGIKIKDKRGLCVIDKVDFLPAQKFVKIDPLKSKTIVKVGSVVQKGTLIAQYTGVGGPNIYSSISGTVMEIRPYILIQNDYKETETTLTILSHPTKKQIIERIKQAGIIGLGGAGFCTNIKYETKEKIHTLLINAVECENYLNCDETVLKVYTKQVFDGIKFLQKASGAQRVILCLQKRNKKHLIFLKSFLNDYEVEVAFVTNKYGVGAEKILIKEVLKIDVLDKEIPAVKGIIVNNLQTAWAVFKAIKQGLPLTQRVASITGLSIKNPGNYFLPNGAVVEEIISGAGGLKYDYVQMEDYKYSTLLIMQEVEDLKELYRSSKTAEKRLEYKIKLRDARARLKKEVTVVRKQKLKEYRLCLSEIILGGLLSGTPIEDIQDSVKLTHGGVLLLSNLEHKKYAERRCINCKRCVKVCPKKLHPELLNKNIETGKSLDNLRLDSCFECGCCNFVCPSKICLKEKFREQKNK